MQNVVCVSLPQSKDFSGCGGLSLGPSILSYYLFTNSALISATTLCCDGIRTLVSRAAQDWDLSRTLFRLSYSAASSYLHQPNRQCFQVQPGPGFQVATLRLASLPADGLVQVRSFLCKVRREPSFLKIFSASVSATLTLDIGLSYLSVFSAQFD